MYIYIFIYTYIYKHIYVTTKIMFNHVEGSVNKLCKPKIIT